MAAYLQDFANHRLDQFRCTITLLSNQHCLTTKPPCSMAAYFSNDCVALPGVAKFFKVRWGLFLALVWL